MSWRDELRSASFRGLPFFVATSEGEVGRRTVTHEFAGRDTPFVEDLGRATRRIQLEGYVLGPDYMADRDELRAAFETAGPGRLVHPWWGELDVALDGTVRWTESTDEGGMARLSCAFVEAGDATPPAARQSTVEAVELAADVAVAAVADDFVEEWSADNLASSYLADAIAMVQAAVSAVRAVKGKIDAALRVIDDVTAAIDAVADAVASLILFPRVLANKLIGVYATVVGAIASIAGAAALVVADEADEPIFGGGTSTTTPPSSVDTPVEEPSSERLIAIMLGTVRDVTGFAVVIVPDTGATTPQREQRSASARALDQLVRAIGVIEGCRVAARLKYVSYEQADAVRAELAERIDDLLPDASDELYTALVDLRTSMALHLATAGEELPRELRWTPPVTLPALVIAHHLYGDARREAELVERNRLPHPGFVAGGEPLRVLSHD